MKVIPFTPGRDIPREIAEKVADLATGKGRDSILYTRNELAEVVLVALGAYREATAR